MLAQTLDQPALGKTLKPVKDLETESRVIGLYNQALKYSKAERNVHARVILEKAATYDPTSVSGHIHAVLSEIYHELGNPDRAIKEAKLSLHYDPSRKTIYYNLGVYCKDARRYEEGIAYLTKYAQSVSGEKRNNALSLIQNLITEQSKAGSFSHNDADYLDELSAVDGAHHWGRDRVPLKVFIEADSSARGFRKDFPELAHSAFVTWYQASGKKLSFTFVDNLADADINVEWTDGVLKVGDEKYERTKAGLTTTRRRGDFIEHARIQIRTVRAFSRELEPTDRIKETCLHEVGHALGLNGHSSNTADIMYFGNTTRQLPALTKRDKATIARLYEAYPRYPMIGVDTSFPYPPPETSIPRLSTGAGSDTEYTTGDSGTSPSPVSTSLLSTPPAASTSPPNQDDEHLTPPPDMVPPGDSQSGWTTPSVGGSPGKDTASSTTIPAANDDMTEVVSVGTTNSGAGSTGNSTGDSTIGSTIPGTSPASTTPGLSGLVTPPYQATNPPTCPLDGIRHQAAMQAAPVAPTWPAPQAATPPPYYPVPPLAAQPAYPTTFPGYPAPTSPAWPAQTATTPVYPTPTSPGYPAPTSPAWPAQTATTPAYPTPTPGYPAPAHFPGYPAMPAPPGYPSPYTNTNTQPAPQFPPPTAISSPEQVSTQIQSPAQQNNPLLQFAQQFFPQPQRDGQTANQDKPVSGPEAANPLIQFAQQFFPPSGGQQTGAGSTSNQPPAIQPAQVIDQVMKLFQPPKQGNETQ